MNIDNMTARELMEILNHLFDEFGSIDRSMTIGALSMYFRMHEQAQESLQEATQDDEATQSNNSIDSTTEATERHSNPKRIMPSRKRAITVNGVTYESIKTACLRLGVKYSTVTQATYRHHTAPEKVIEFLLNKRSMNEA